MKKERIKTLEEFFTEKEPLPERLDLLGEYVFKDVEPLVDDLNSRVGVLETKVAVLWEAFCKNHIAGKTNIEAMSKTKALEKPVPYVEILKQINEAIGAKFRPVESNLKLIKARRHEGASIKDLVDVAVFKHREWKDDPDMRKYLRIETLYNATKFQSYLAEVDAAKEREAQYDELR